MRIRPCYDFRELSPWQNGKLRLNWKLSEFTLAWIKGKTDIQKGWNECSQNIQSRSLRTFIIECIESDFWQFYGTSHDSYNLYMFEGRSREIWQNEIFNYFFIPDPFWMFYAFYIVSLPFVEIISSFETKSVFFVEIESTNRSDSWAWFRIKIFKMGRLPWLYDAIIGATNSHDLLNLKRNLLELI